MLMIGAVLSPNSAFQRWARPNRPYDLLTNGSGLFKLIFLTIIFAVCNQEEDRSMSKTQWFSKKDLVRRTGGSSRMFALSLFACCLLFYPGTLTSAQSMFPENRNH